MPPHVLAVFKQLFDELKSMKQQQWTITNYSLLILAAIYAVRQLLPEVPHSQTYLKILAGVIAVAGSIRLLSSYCAFNQIWHDHAGAWMTFTRTFLHQMTSRPLAGLTSRYGNFTIDPGGSASWHIGAEAWSLLFLSFLS